MQNPSEKRAQRIAIFGAGGMLGRAVASAVAGAGHQAVPFTHEACNIGDPSDVLIRMELEGGRDEIDAAINCAGVTDGTPSQMAVANAAGPHILADYCGRKDIRLVHVSTDCVFSGEPDPAQPARKLSSDDLACPNSFYGRTKLTGEPSGAGSVTARTSFIGLESGLLAWLVAQEGGRIKGWRRAWWTGSTVYVVARRLVELATMAYAVADDVGLLLNLATPERISKFEMLTLCRDALGLNVEIEPVDKPHIDLALAPHVPLQSLDKSLPELVQHWKHSDAAKARP